jgi:hypothetical protein
METLQWLKELTELKPELSKEIALVSKCISISGFDDNSYNRELEKNIKDEVRTKTQMKKNESKENND